MSTLHVIVSDNFLFSNFLPSGGINIYSKCDIDMVHPNTQFKKAKEILLDMKQLKGEIYDGYVNTYSAVFVEAVEVLSEQIGVDVEFYLQKGDVLVKIHRKLLYQIYNNLGDIYDEIDKIRGQNMARQLRGNLE